MIYTRALLRGYLVALPALWRILQDGDAVAAKTLWRVNRAAGAGEIAWGPAYALKNHAVRVLYRRHGARVTEHVQTFECWGPYRADACEGPACERCGGTGVWRENRLLLFDFTIEGRRYRWHQPRSLVRWPVAVDQDPTPYRAQGRDGQPMFRGAWDRDRAFMTLYLWLRLAGVPAAALPRIGRLRRAIGHDLRYWWSGTRLSSRCTTVRRRWREWWSGRGKARGPLAPAYGPEVVDDDDLPF